MPKAKSTYPEINDIKDDLESLKGNVIDLTKQIKANGIAQSQELKQTASERLDDIKVTKEKQLKKVEEQVKAKPAQSLATAFAVGFVASLLLGRR